MKICILNQYHALLAFLCCAFILLPFLSALFSPPNLHPLSIPGPSWQLLDRLARGELRSRQSGPDEERRALERVLRKAAMPDKTVLITTVNQAWVAENTMIDLFLESFRIGNGTAPLLAHLVIVALDQKAYDRCILLHSRCFKLKTEGVDFSGEKIFMSSDYLRMMWRRVNFLREVLEEGYSFLFTDADIIWFRNPFPLLSPDVDFQIACDHYVGNPNSLRNRANGGFMFARSNRRTIEFYKYWYTAREVFPGKHDQDVFNKIKRDDALIELGLRWTFLDTKYVSGFCEPSVEVEKICTMHANCCYGMMNKVEDLRLILGDWKKFKSMTPLEKRRQKFSWSAPKACVGSSHLVH